MDKENNITTAANSRTMNAVENTKLFAAAAEPEPAINFRDNDQDGNPHRVSKNQDIKKQKKQKNNPAGNK